jgi:hypothetical protein
MIKNVTINEPSIKSDSAQWIQWHKDLKSTFGKKTANSVFLAFWNKRKSSGANTAELRDYAESQGFKIEGGSLSGIADAAYDIGDTIGDVMQVGKIVAISLTVILVAGIGLLIYNVARNPQGTITAIKG